MDNRYLIPANTKKGTLIFGVFRTVDLIIFGIGVSITILAMFIFQASLSSSTAMTVACLAPAGISAVLVMPVPYYHNTMNVLKECYEFLTQRQKFVWKGWCFTYESNKK